MVGSRNFRHHGYELLCSAQAVAAGKFAPTLVICTQAWPKRPRVIAVRRGDFVTEEAAIDSAYAQGVEWIRDFG